MGEKTEQLFPQRGSFYVLNLMTINQAAALPTAAWINRDLKHINFCLISMEMVVHNAELGGRELA